MLFTRASIAAVALGAIQASATYFVPLSAANVTQCDVITMNFKGQAPFTVAVYPSCDEDSTTETPLASISNVSTSSLTWKVNQAAGKGVMFEVSDANGNVDYSDDYEIAPSSDASCVGVKPSFNVPSATTSASVGLPTTQLTPNNVGGGEPASTTTSVKALGGAIGGAVSNFAPRVEVAALVVIGSSMAALFL